MKEVFNEFYFKYSEKEVGCGYHYLISTPSFSHTAFRTYIEFQKWLEVTGLIFDEEKEIITGQYTRQTEMTNTDEFYKKYAGMKTFYALDNADYTIGFIENTDNGNILHIQNPNTDRPILNYFKIMVHLETGKEVRNCYHQHA